MFPEEYFIQQQQQQQHIMAELAVCMNLDKCIKFYFFDKMNYFVFRVQYYFHF